MSQPDDVLCLQRGTISFAARSADIKEASVGLSIRFVVTRIVQWCRVHEWKSWCALGTFIKSIRAILEPAASLADLRHAVGMSERFALRSGSRSDHVLAVKQAVTVKLWGMSVRYPLSDTTNRPSVCAFVCRSLGYRHTGCLQLADTRDGRAADPSADGRRSAASRNCHRRGHIVSPSPGR